MQVSKDKIFASQTNSDVVIIGGGIAAWAAAYVTKVKDSTLKVSVIQPKEIYSSLSEWSTAVAWFPDKNFHTVDTFQQFDKDIDVKHVNQFIQSSYSTRPFWLKTLNMSQWPFDNYGEGGKSYDYVKTGGVYGRRTLVSKSSVPKFESTTPCGLPLCII